MYFEMIEPQTLDIENGIESTSKTQEVWVWNDFVYFTLILSEDRKF